MNSAILDQENQVLQQAEEWLRGGQRVVLATVIATWGSSPCPAGSQLAVNEAGVFSGSVSAGCIEASVIHQAGLVMADGEPRLLRYGVSNEQAWEAGLACGGTIELYLEPVE